MDEAPRTDAPNDGIEESNLDELNQDLTEAADGEAAIDDEHEAAVEESPLVDEASSPYLGRWNRLVSTTNWEKGRIIAEWRQALVDAGADAAAYTDEAWSQRVGNVTPQHVGRLRRVYHRFGQAYPQYDGLFWSHFQAAVDWEDAEMWLEGAVQNDWSISQMRDSRWEAIGAPAELKPRPEDITEAELDEDVDEAVEAPMPDTISPMVSEVRSEEDAERDESQSDFHAAEEVIDYDVDDSPGADSLAAEAEPFRPFENLAELPADLNEAFESFKLAILHHKISTWQEVSAETVVSALEALKQLALAPVED